MIISENKFHSKISFIQYDSETYYIGYESGLFQIFSKSFHLLFEKKEHYSIILNIFIEKNTMITFSITETIIWKRDNFLIEKKITNGLFFKILSLKDNIIFGSISGDLFLWDLIQDEIKPILYSYHTKNIKDIIYISKKFILSYSTNEMILWKVPSFEKKIHEKREKDWISTISVFKKDSILVGFYDISIYSIESFHMIKKIKGNQEKIYSILPLFNDSFLVSSEYGTITYYVIEDTIKKDILEKRYLESSFTLKKNRQDIFFFMKDTIYFFQNPLLQKEKKNYLSFLEKMEKNKKEHCIFHNKDLVFYISFFLF